MSAVQKKPAFKKNGKQAQTEATLRELMDAAEKIFVRDGYARAQIDSIAAEVGRTKGAVYAHFKSKEDLFFALMERHATARVEMARQAMAGVTPQEAFAALRRLYIATVDEETWAILKLEFKLFALRHTGALERIKALNDLLYEEFIQLPLDKTNVKTEASTQARAVALAVLAAMPSAVVLERHFSPVLGDKAAAESAMRTMFEAFL